ncbi:unnamed protein product [Bursaphelenchus okinawaensis]|uniref:Uncharacterized protein n=1 Tax=Bursaphelenchus okinawaensis TaxID=465554 RepID=A0A811K9N4_9BILA|nr:unnamed protein product [Bursaphelenchus okinawaensis]CAG9096150.1 unnamed protein product [Bursaphelenchus okinawaensis]
MSSTRSTETLNDSSVHKSLLIGPLQNLVNEGTEDEATGPLIGDEHHKLWVNLVYEMFLTTMDSRKLENRTICLPQVIASLYLVGEIGPTNSNFAVRAVLNPQGAEVPRHIYGNIPFYIREWEQHLSTYAKPNGYWSARRVLVHRENSKSYGVVTFVLLKKLGVELKLSSKENEKELIHWLRRDLKLVDSNFQPFKLWLDEVNEQSEQNRRCPIIASASHFRFQIPSSFLDGNNVYTTKFQFNEKRTENVLSCLIQATPRRTIKYITLDQCELIEVPVVSEHLKVYIITKWDKCIIKTGTELTAKIQLLRTGQSFKELRKLYLPMFDESQNNVSNVAEFFVRCIPDTDKSYQNNGFGDLACEGAEASSSFTNKLTANTQHFDYLELMHLPQVTSYQDIATVSEKSQNDQLVISNPFAIIVWDTKKNVPVYLSRIVLPNLLKGFGDKVSSAEKNDEKAPSKWPKLKNWFKPKAKSVKTMDAQQRRSGSTAEL